MTNPNVEVILERLGALAEKIDDLQEDVTETKEQAKLTNGRVTTLELWQARWQGAQQAMSWLPTVGTGVVIGVIVAVASHLLG